jgi:hypothetical protein
MVGLMIRLQYTRNGSSDLVLFLFLTDRVVVVVSSARRPENSRIEKQEEKIGVANEPQTASTRPSPSPSPIPTFHFDVDEETDTYYNSHGFRLIVFKQLSLLFRAVCITVSRL